MRTEQEIVDKLIDRFDFLQDNIRVQRSKRIFTEMLSREEFDQVIHYVHDKMGFSKATHVVGTDEGEDLGFIYVLSNEDGIILALKQKAPKSQPEISTRTDIYPSLEMHERELVDLFGVVVKGLAPGLTYPLPDGWPKGSYPLRKEWNPEYFDKSTMTYNPPAAHDDKEGENK